MRTRLRRLLDLIVEPPRTYSGRHLPSVPTTPRHRPIGVDEWVSIRWADIAARHGIEDNDG